MPLAVSGNHGHDATFAVAVTLRHGFALSKAAAWPIMREFNARCEPPWSEKELEHKLDSAEKVTRHPKPRGHLLGERWPTRGEPSPEIKSSGAIKIIEVDTSEPLPGENASRYETEKHLEPSAKEPEKPKGSVASVQAAGSELTPDQLAEARRIAASLVKLHARGIIQDAADPEARFYAGMLNMFSATVVNGDKTTAPDAPAKLTAAQLVKVPSGLRGKALADYLQRDLEAAIGDGDDL
jgi:hypothetical protein